MSSATPMLKPRRLRPRYATEPAWLDQLGFGFGFGLGLVGVRRRVRPRPTLALLLTNGDGARLAPPVRALVGGPDRRADDAGGQEQESPSEAALHARAQVPAEEPPAVSRALVVREAG